MFFKKLRSRSKSSSKSTKHSIDRITSSTSTHNETLRSKIPEMTISRPAEDIEGDDAEQNDYKEFLEKAKREAERKERELARSIMRARETNLSPWAGRM